MAKFREMLKYDDTTVNGVGVCACASCVQFHVLLVGWHYAACESPQPPKYVFSLFDPVDMLVRGTFKMVGGSSPIL